VLSRSRLDGEGIKPKSTLRIGEEDILVLSGFFNLNSEKDLENKENALKLIIQFLKTCSQK